MPRFQRARAALGLIALGATLLVAVRVVTASAADAASPSPYASAVLTDNPAAYWRLGEQTGTSLADSSGHGITATETSGGQLGVSGALATENDTALAGAFTADAASLPNGGAARTVEAWVRGSNGSVSVGYGRTATADGFAVTVTPGSNTITVSDGDDLGAVGFGSPLSLGDGSWHLVDVSFDGSTVTGYVDGQPIGSESFTGQRTVVAGQTLSASGPNGLDEVAVYPGAVVAAHLAARWSRARAGAAACPVTPTKPYPLVALGDTPAAYYRLGELSGDLGARVAFDSSGRCADAALGPQDAPISGALLGDADTAVTGTVLASAAGLPSGAAARTVEAWFHGGNGVLDIGYGRTGTSDGFEITVNPNAQAITVSDGDSFGADRFGASIDGGWHLLDVTLADGTVTAFLDARALGTAPLGGLTTVVAGQPLVISAALGVDEVAIYPSALDSGDVGLHFLRGTDTAKSVVQGIVTTGGTAVPGALVELCSADHTCSRIETAANGGYRFPVGYGAYTLTIFPPPSGTGSDTTLATTAATTTAQAPYAQVDVALQRATLPSGSSLTSTTFGTQTSGVPTVYWQEPTVYKTTGCPDGYGYLTVTVSDPTTGAQTGRFVPLTESPAGSGNYRATIPPLAPLHGSSHVQAHIVCGPRSTFFPHGGTSAGGTDVFVRSTRALTAVRFGSQPGTGLTQVTGDLYKLRSPAGSGDVALTITRADGTSATLGTFHYVDATVTGGHSGPANGGGTVHLTGHGFGPQTQVLFGYRPSLSIHVISSTELTAEVPPGHGTAPITIYSDGGVSPAGGYDYDGTEAAKALLEYELKLVDFDYLLMDLMFAADEGNVVGLGVTIVSYLLQEALGESLPEEDQIYLEGYSVLVETAGLLLGIEVTIPALIGAVVVVAFLLLIDPSGTVVDLDGIPVRGARVTLLRKRGATFRAVPNGDQTIDPTTNPITTGAAGTFAWQATAGTYEVRASSPRCVDAGGARITATTDPFTIPPEVTGILLTLPCHLGTAPRPAVTSVSPPIVSTAGGDTITVAGTGFTDVTAVTIASTPATSFRVLSPTAIQVVVPAGAGSADVTVTSAGLTSRVLAADRLTYVSPATGLLDPDVGAGAVDQPVTFTGSGLASVTAITSPDSRITFRSVQAVSDHEVTALVSVRRGVPVGAADVTLETSTGPDVSCPGCLQVTYPPVLDDGAALVSVVAGGDAVSASWPLHLEPGGTLLVAHTPGIVLRVLSNSGSAVVLSVRAGAAVPAGTYDVTFVDPDGGRSVGTGLVSVTA